MISTVVAIVLGGLSSALFSGIETGSYMINRIRLRRYEQERKRSALRLSRVLGRPYIFIYTVLICNNIANYMVSMGMTDLYLSAGLKETRMLLGFVPWSAEVAATLTLMFPLFLFAELGPKNLFRKKADVLMYRLSGVMRLLVGLFFPLTWTLKQLFRVLTHGRESSTGEELHRLSLDALREYFSAGEKEGVISSHQNQMLDNVTSMHRTAIREVMTPFAEIPRLPVSATVADFKRLIRRHRSTYAIMVQRHAVVGFVSLFTVVSRKLGEAETLQAFAENVLLLPEGGNIKSAFYRLRRNPRHSAVVVDSRKHPVGVVRLEDVARYIAKQ